MNLENIIFQSKSVKISILEKLEALEYNSIPQVKRAAMLIFSAYIGSIEKEFSDGTRICYLDIKYLEPYQHSAVTDLLDELEIEYLSVS